MLALLAAMGLRQPASAADCEQDLYEGTRVVVCTADPGSADLRLFWNDAGGKPYRRFSKVAEAVEREGGTLVFALNAGMYLPDFSPIGLYVENGKELRPVNTETVEGSPGQIPNFFKKPNGVFFFGRDRAGILPTEAYLQLRPDADFAT